MKLNDALAQIGQEMIKAFQTNPDLLKEFEEWKQLQEGVSGNDKAIN